MKGKSFKTENRDLAFRKYCECGGNVEMTLRELGKEGLKLSKPTFYEWMEKFNFEDRSTKIDAEKQKAADSQISFEETMLNALITRKDVYEKWFEENHANIDHQAQYAYAGIIKSILDMKMRLKSVKASMFVEFMKDFISFLSKHDDTEAVGIIEKHFDDFMKYARELYGA
jgi:hypothetical protein